MEPKKQSEINRGREWRVRRGDTDYHTVITTWGGGGRGSINIPFIYTDIQGVVGDPVGPPPASMPQGGAREGHLSPQVTPWGLGDCPWRSAGSSGGGRGGRLPRGHHLFPRQLLALEVLGSVWKAVWRELEDRVGNWAYFWGGPGQAAPPEDRPGSSWLHGFLGDPEQGRLGLLPAQLPLRSGKLEKRGRGFKERTWHLLASWKS